MRRTVPSRRLPLAAAGIASLVAAALTLPTASAAGDTVALSATPATHTVTYAGHAPFNNGQDGLVYGQTGLDDPTNACSPKNTTLNTQRTITVTVPPRIDPAYDTLIRFQINWTPIAAEVAEDMALYVFGPDGGLVGSSDGSQASEGINLTSATPGRYNMLVCAFQTPPQGTDFVGSVTTYTKKPAVFPKASGVTAPTYAQFTAPTKLATAAGEPSIGNSWKTGHTLFTANTDEYDVAFDDAKRTATWTSVNADPNGSNAISLDPIGYTDSATGRSFVSQLLVVCSGAAFSDDDFTTSTPSQGCGSGINGGDHQTVGGGPFPAGVSPLLAYPHAVYYCSQSAAFVAGGAFCSRSDDGGLTFGAPVEIFTAACNGIHGHVRVGPDGSVYVPDDNCAGKHGLTVSRDGGATWTVRQIPDSIAGSSDSSVSVGADNTVYYGYNDGTGKPKVAVSRDHGATWAPSVDVGLPYGIHNGEFSEMIAGDGDRASMAFLGTPTRGSTQAASFGKDKAGTTFTGAEWHMYVATTYDRGRTWTTVDATPTDPVQRGCVWNSGGSNPCRNLLDFEDITVTKTGRVMVGFADGCVPATVEAKNDCVASTAVASNGLVNHGAIVRQMSGKGLFKAYDAAKPVVTKPVSKPVAATPVTPAGTPVVAAPRAAGRRLATTGGAPALAGLGVLLLGAALLARRRRTA